MILIWFNPQKLIIYHRYIKMPRISYYLGYVNSYNHIVIQIFIVSDGKLISIKSYDDYLRERYIKSLKLHKEDKSRLITYFKKLLNKKE